MMDQNDEVNIYKGEYYINNPVKTKLHKVVVLDVDETLGYFFELKILWNYVASIDPCFKTSQYFNRLLDLYPEFLRYGIVSILDYIYQKKKRGDCYKVYIYTNNQFESRWTNLILDYFIYKLDCDIRLFDQVICAFKINNKKVEMKRTTHMKTYDDLISCTMLPTSTEICFIDNNYFHNMQNERVYYIQPLSYYHNMTKEEIVCRFLQSDLWIEMNRIAEQTNPDHHHSDFLGQVFYPIHNAMSVRKTKIDIYVAQKMMYHIKEFFYFPKNNRTRKNKMLLNRLTRKRHVTLLP